MKRNIGSACLKEFSHLSLCQPDGFILETNFDLLGGIIRLINDNFAFFRMFIHKSSKKF